MPDVAVVIPARDAAATLPRALAALAAMAPPVDAEVVVVDDASSDATAAVARAAGVRVVAGPGRGPGAARNAGAAATTAPVLAFTDADCAPAPDWLARGLAALASADLVQGAVVPERPPGPLDRTIRVVAPSGLFETANLLVRRAVFDRAGGFAPGLTPGGGKELGEDVVFGWAARRAGARVAFAPDAVVAHAVVARGAAGFVAERSRLRAFPALVRRVPELRAAALHRRVFLTPRTAAFDLAVAGALLAAATRRPAPLVLALGPYARVAARAGAGLPPRARARLAAVHLAADAVGCAALVTGSVRARTPVL